MRLRSLAALVMIAASANCGSDSGTGTTPTIAAIVIANVLTAVNPGNTLQLVVFAFGPSGELLISPGAFNWTSSSTSVATVSQTGVVTAVAAGTTTISASLGGATGTMDIVVSAKTAATKDTVSTLPVAFVPNITTIALGQSVTWVFGGGIAHNVIFKTGNPPGSPPDIQNATNLVFVRTFNSRGTFTYDCTVHPGMSGQVLVQ
ncbi:MAG: Ig-like domain-containing protein [bacterium]